LKQIYKALVCLSAQYTVVPLIPLKGLGEGIAIPDGVDEGLGLHVGLHVGHLHRHLFISALSSSTSLGSSSTLCALDRHLVGTFVSLHVDWDYPGNRAISLSYIILVCPIFLCLSLRFHSHAAAPSVLTLLCHRFIFLSYLITRG